MSRSQRFNCCCFIFRPNVPELDNDDENNLFEFDSEDNCVDDGDNMDDEDVDEEDGNEEDFFEDDNGDVETVDEEDGEDVNDEDNKDDGVC